MIKNNSRRRFICYKTLNMKCGFFVVLSLFSLLAAAQPRLKVYGYSQVFTPGMIPAEDARDDNGEKKIKMPRFITNYFIFIETDSSIKIEPYEIWIGNKWDTVAGLSVVARPVMSEYPEKKELVPIGKGRVIQLSVGDTLRRGVSRSVAVKTMMKENELIIGYRWKGKKYYARLKKLVELPPVHGA